MSRLPPITREEVEALSTRLGHADKAAELAAWYDGYDFGGEATYNPWSVLNYLDQGCIAQPYWTSTSSNEVVRRLIGRADTSLNASLTSIAEGGSVKEPLDLSAVFGEIDSDASAIWSQLYLAGYLTTHDVAEPNNQQMVRRLEVPNLEVERLFQGELLDRAYRLAGGRGKLVSLHTALRTGNAEALTYELEGVLLDTVSYHDLQSENSCHMWLLSLLYGMEGYRYPRSMREVGRGRPDIVCEPDASHEGELAAIVIEVKFLSDATSVQLKAIADAAISDQALPKRYDHGLVDTGAVLWSVAFNAHKHVSVARS